MANWNTTTVAGDIHIDHNTYVGGDIQTQGNAQVVGNVTIQGTLTTSHYISPDKGAFESYDKLVAAHPTALDNSYAIVGTQTPLKAYMWLNNQWTLVAQGESITELVNTLSALVDDCHDKLMTELESAQQTAQMQVNYVKNYVNNAKESLAQQVSAVLGVIDGVKITLPFYGFGSTTSTEQPIVYSDSLGQFVFADSVSSETQLLYQTKVTTAGINWYKVSDKVLFQRGALQYKFDDGTHELRLIHPNSINGQIFNDGDITIDTYDTTAGRPSGLPNWVHGTYKVVTGLSSHGTHLCIVKQDGTCDVYWLIHYLSGKNGMLACKEFVPDGMLIVSGSKRYLYYQGRGLVLIDTLIDETGVPKTTHDVMFFDGFFKGEGLDTFTDWQASVGNEYIGEAGHSSGWPTSIDIFNGVYFSPIGLDAVKNRFVAWVSRHIGASNVSYKILSWRDSERWNNATTGHPYTTKLYFNRSDKAYYVWDGTALRKVPTEVVDMDNVPYVDD